MMFITGLIIGVVVGLCIGGYLGWEMKKDANTTTFTNVTIKLNAQDLIDIREAEDSVDDLKDEIGI